MPAKLRATELCLLVFGFLCCVFSGGKENMASKTELGLNSLEHIESNCQCLAECISLLIRKLIGIHFSHWKNARVLPIDLRKQ